MENLKIENTIIFFDVETTGLDVNEDRIIQFAAVKVSNDGTRELKNIFIDPGIPIKKEASDVHHLYDADVAGCPSFVDCASEIYHWMGSSDLAGYNILVFDLPILIEEFGRAGLELDLSNRYLIDLFKIYRALKPANLESVYKEYVGGTYKAHDAAGDAIATYELAVEMMNKEIEKVGDCVSKWEAFSFDRSKMVDFAGKFIRNDEGVICFNVGKDKGKPVKENPSFLKWMIDKEFPNDTKNWARKLLNS